MIVLIPGYSCVVNAGLAAKNVKPPSPPAHTVGITSPFQAPLPTPPALIPVSEFESALSAGFQDIYILQTPTQKDAPLCLRHTVLTPGKNGSPRFVRVAWDPAKIPGYSPVNLSLKAEYLPDGKIPIRLFHEIKAFFKEVIVRHGTSLEAMIWVVWNEEKGYHLIAPTQTVAGASAHYEWSDLPEDVQLVVDIHSHANFNAFFSSTDDRDDSNSIRISGVIGHNASTTQDHVWRFNCRGQRTPLQLTDIFEQERIEVGPVPDFLLNKVSLSQPSHAKYAPDSPRNPYYFNRLAGHSAGSASKYSSQSQRRVNQRYPELGEESEREANRGKESSDKEGPPLPRQSSLWLPHEQVSGFNRNQGGGSPGTQVSEKVSEEGSREKQGEKVSQNDLVKKMEQRTSQEQILEDAEEIYRMLAEGEDFVNSQIERDLQGSNGYSHKDFAEFDFPTRKVDPMETGDIIGFDEYLATRAFREQEKKEAMQVEKKPADTSLRIEIPDGNIPAQYNELVINHGMAAADAFAAAAYGLTTLLDHSMHQEIESVVESAFFCLEESRQLDTFRRLYRSLSPADVDKLASQGF